MKKIILGLFLGINVGSVSAQGILYDNAFFNLLATNPAFAGARKDFNLNALLGNRFNGTATPQQTSQIFSMDGQVGQHANGLGLQAFNSNQLSSINTQGVIVDYAYRQTVGNAAQLALGLRAGFTYLPSFFANTNSGVSQFFPYLGIGALLHADDFFVSISKPVLFNKGSNIDQFINQKTMFTAVGYSFEPNDKIMFNPSLRYDINSIDGNAFGFATKLWFSRKFGIGITLKHKNESFTYNTISYTKFIESIEVQVSKGIRLGISYDNNANAGINQGSNTVASGGIFQIFLRYESVSDRVNSNRLKYF